MNEIFDGYIENNFGEQKQCPVKKAQFHYNYKKFFPDVQRIRNVWILELAEVRC